MYSVKVTILILILAFLPIPELFPGQHIPASYYFAIELNGTLCGYSQFISTSISQNGRDLIELKQKMYAKMSALGSRFDQELKLTYHIDPATGNFIYHDSELLQGPNLLSSAIHVANDTAYFTSSSSPEVVKTFLSQDVVLPNTLYNDYLLHDFVQNKMQNRTYQTYEVREQRVQKISFTKAGEEKLNLADGLFDSVILDQFNHDNGLKLRIWVDKKSGMTVKAVYPNGRSGYLTDASVMDKIGVADIRTNILFKTDKAIPDIKNISYMRVQAVLEPSGLLATQEGLNGPGQKFTGTIQDNLIDGIFEIRYKKYDGVNAPPFPPAFTEQFVPHYLAPVAMIESDDPVLIKQAVEITSGSGDAWEAACRLSQWVAVNIQGGIQGGLGARKTYDLRVGDCGGHSMLLAALCRAVGIPARVVWGCMYTPIDGGAFGQHAWNEIYMGESGWIPVDATAREIDYADSGHLRLGEYSSFATALNAKSIKILDYEAKSAGITSENDKHDPYLGTYTNPEKNNKLIVSVQNGSLTVDIVGKVVLTFHDADINGNWGCTISDRIYLSFTKNDSDKISRLFIHEIATMPKVSDSTLYSGTVPKDLTPYIGLYRFYALNKDFLITGQDSALILHESEGDGIVLSYSQENNTWGDQQGRRSIFFESDDNGKIKSMKITYISSFDKVM